MGKKLSLSIRVLWLFLFSLWNSLLWSCSDEGDTKVSDEYVSEINPAHDMAIHDFLVENYRLQDKRWSMQSTIGLVFNNDQLVLLRDVVLNFYNTGNSNSLVSSDTEVTSRKGIYHQDSRDIDLYENVTINSKNGVHLYSESIHYYDAEQMFKSNDFVKVVYASGSTLQGYGMEADVNLNKIVFSKPIEGMIKREDINKRL